MTTGRLRALRPTGAVLLAVIGLVMLLWEPLLQQSYYMVRFGDPMSTARVIIERPAPEAPVDWIKVLGVLLMLPAALETVLRLWERFQRRMKGETPS